MQAAGTLAGTNISNVATVNYTVSAVAQPALTANADFVVDRRIDMTLTPVPVALVSVTPGTAGNLIAFTLTNTSNAALDFTTAAANRANGTADPYGGATADGFDSTNASFADNNNSSAYESGTDTVRHRDQPRAPTRRASCSSCRPSRAVRPAAPLPS